MDHFVSQNPHGWYQRTAGGGEEDGQRRAAGEHLGSAAHGQDRTVSAVQPAVWRRHGEVRTQSGLTDLPYFSLCEIFQRGALLHVPQCRSAC